MSKSVKIVFGKQEDKYKGNTYCSYKASVDIGGGKAVLVTIPCDDSGNIPKYSTKNDGTELIYAYAVGYTKKPKGEKRNVFNR